MGRRDKAYRKDLHQQAYERLNDMQCFGESKKAARSNGTAQDKVFSYQTYETYWKHIKGFLRWVNAVHPECTTLKAAQKYVSAWLKFRISLGLSAWTIHTDAAAVNKLYGISKDDPERIELPRRNRADIKRSRLDVKRDRHFSENNNIELVQFCRGTGCRRNVLERLEGRDLWTKAEMKEKVYELECRDDLTEKERKHLAALKDALSVFPDHDAFIHHRKDKNGKYRFAPIIGPNKDKIVARMKATGSHEKVWQHVHSAADIHSYRAEYATALYKAYARPIDQIPYDRINKGTGRKYQGDLYVCRNDEAGRQLDRAAMMKCSKALGHNRVYIVADNYIRGLT